MRRLTLLAVLVFGLVPPVSSQPRVDPKNLYERLICVVPMVGAGTYTDPRRPLFAPTQADVTGDGIIQFSFEESDDGKFAIVELVARDRKAFAAILADRRPEIKVFEKGKHSRAEIETELKKYKRNFDTDKWVKGR